MTQSFVAAIVPLWTDQTVSPNMILSKTIHVYTDLYLNVVHRETEIPPTKKGQISSCSKISNKVCVCDETGFQIIKEEFYNQPVKFNTCFIIQVND